MLRRLEAVAIFLASFALAAFVVARKTQVEHLLTTLGILAMPLAIVILAIVASAPFSVTDALAIMNGVIFGPLWGSVVNALGIVLAAIIGYVVALRTSALLDIEAQVQKLPSWVRRFKIGSPMFLICVRIIPGLGGTIATQTAAALRVPIFRQIYTMCAIAVPICTALAIGGDFLSTYIEAHVVRPAEAYAEKHHIKMRLPHVLRHSTPPPRIAPGSGPMNDVILVDTPALLATLIERVKTAPRVGIDTEFHNERSYTAQLMVVQLSFTDGVAIVDPLALRDLQPLFDALAQTRIVGHALSSDLRIIAEDYATLPVAAFDTQVAAAFCGFGLTISLLDLVRELARVTLRKSQTVSDWSTRPLTPKQIDYLVDDVRYLFTLADALEERLSERGRETWAREEMRSLVDVRTYRSDGRRLYLRISGNARMNRRELGILNELAGLRDRLARERNIPLKYVMPDDVLAGLVSLRPKTVAELAQLRRLDGGIKKNYGALIVEAVARGEEIPEDQLPQRAPRPLGSQREALVSTMAVLVNSIAAENDLPHPAASRSALERVARDTPASADEIDAVLELAPWRRSLIVEPLWQLLTGERVVRVEGYANGNPHTTLSARRLPPRISPLVNRE